MSQAREMINAHLFPILAVVATVSSVSVAISLRPIAQHSTRWNLCYTDSMAWYQANKPDWTVQDKEVFASNFCNGGNPVTPGPGFQPATWSGSGSCRSTYQCWLRCVCPSWFTLIILLVGVSLLALVTFRLSEWFLIYTTSSCNDNTFIRTCCYWLNTMTSLSFLEKSVGGNELFVQ